MFTGYSALAMAEALPVDGRLVACEIDAEVAALARGRSRTSPAGERITVEVGPAADTLRRARREPARGSTWCSSTPTRRATPTTSRRCSTPACSPRTAWSPSTTPSCRAGRTAGRAGERTANGDAIAAFNETVAADPRVEQVLCRCATA